MERSNISYNHFDRIEDYLFDRLNTEDKAAFEQETAQNPQLADELAIQKLEHQAMELGLQSSLRAQLAAWADAETATGAKVVSITSAQENTQQTPQLVAKPTRRFSIFQYAAAAVLALTISFIGFKFFSSSPSDGLAGEFFEETTSTVRGNSRSLPSDLAKVEALIVTKNYESALTELAKITSETAAQFPDKVKLLKGESEFKLKRYDAAIQTFSDLTKSSIAAESIEQAEWLLALSYQATGKNKSEFEALLTKIITQNDHSFNDQAKRLREKM